MSAMAQEAASGPTATAPLTSVISGCKLLLVRTTQSGSVGATSAGSGKC
jgi:hypothetical protein